MALLWDIDGTLLHTGRAGIFALEDAARDVLGVYVDFSELSTAGLTDVEIAVGIVRQAGRVPDSEIVDRFLRVYERHLPMALPKRKGEVLPGVKEILDRSLQREDVFSILLTGNTHAGAQAKLSYYGLSHYFSDGAFSDGTPDRRSIARRALDLVRGRWPNVGLNRVFVIGDTPHDIHCANAIGVRTIAVATGQYGESDLRALNPWWVLPSLPSQDVFFRHIVDGGHGDRG
ncbi:MAG: haloacid dehalogenase-like hydrolase [Elusimicrobia bacterium]|nr:haloacid dehalogenase-like hydrolase [Elusimicrobiota bacterium]